METKQKMAIAGSGLLVAGMGLAVVGAALIVPAAFTGAVRLLEKGMGSVTGKIEGASKTVGTVVGTLHRSFNQAKRAGVAELKRVHSQS